MVQTCGRGSVHWVTGDEVLAQAGNNNRTAIAAIARILRSILVQIELGVKPSTDERGTQPC